MLAQEAPLIEQGAVQFILFGVTVIVSKKVSPSTLKPRRASPARRIAARR